MKAADVILYGIAGLFGGLLTVVQTAVPAGADRVSRPPAARPVEIRGFVYEPARLEVAVGDTVVWTNADAVLHTATAVDRRWDSGDMGAGQRGRVVMTHAGEHEYTCAYHPSMKARVVVLRSVSR